MAGKKVELKHVEGPVGIQSRNFGNKRIYSIGGKSRFSLEDGLKLTYPWIETQVKAQQQGSFWTSDCRASEQSKT